MIALSVVLQFWDASAEVAGFHLVTLMGPLANLFCGAV